MTYLLVVYSSRRMTSCLIMLRLCFVVLTPAGVFVFDQVGLTQLMEMVASLLQLLLTFYVSRMLHAEEQRSFLMARVASGIQALKGLTPVRQILALPSQVRSLMDDLLELGQILIQLLINTTPLYDLVRTQHTKKTFRNQY